MKGRGVVSRPAASCAGSKSSSSSGKASSFGPQENPIKLDAPLEESFKDEESVEGMCADPDTGLGRRIDNPGDTDDEGWKKAENGKPCEYDSEFSCSV